MIELKTRAEQFLKSIQAEGERQCAAIRRKTDTEVTQSLAAAREEEQARAARTIAFETARAKTQANRALSAARAEARAALTARRQALTDGVFADAEARLAAFTATADYAAWLQASAADLAARLGQGTVLYARRCPRAARCSRTIPSAWAACAPKTAPPTWRRTIRFPPAWRPSAAGFWKMRASRSSCKGESICKPINCTASTARSSPCAAAPPFR